MKINNEINALENVKDTVGDIEITKPDNGIEVTITMHDKVLFHFMLINSATGFGLINWLLSLVALIIFPFAFYQNNMQLGLVMLFIVVLNFVIKPIQLLYQSKLQMNQNNTIKHPIKYTIAKEGVFISQYSGDGKLDWEQINKVRETKTMLLLYIGNDRAFILIKEQMESFQLEQIKDIIQKETNVKNNFR